MDTSNDLYRVKTRDYFGVVKRTVTNLIEDKELGNILDVGGADGGSVQFLIDEGRAKSALVVDPYSESEDTQAIEFRRDNANDLDLYKQLGRDGKTFETVMFLDVLEHLFDPWAVLQTIHDTVHSDDGKLVICMPNARFVGLVVPLVLYGRFDYKRSGVMDKTHIRWFTRATLIEMIEAAGYRIDKIDTVIEPRVRLMNKLTLGLFRGFFEYQYIVQATRI